MFLTINSEVIWSLKSPKSWVMSAIAVERLLTWTNRTCIGVAHHVAALIFYNITRCYGKQVAVFAVAVATGDIIKYQSFVYGSFVWGIHMRYNNKTYSWPVLRKKNYILVIFHGRGRTPPPFWIHVCLICLILFFMSHQQSFSYKGTGLLGLNKY